MSARAVVVGGGLAGIAAAAGLADLGWRVTLVESRPRLGGAAYSFDRAGLTVDTGQHVLLRCYTEYRALLDRMGVGALVQVQPRLAIPVLRPGRPVTWLRRSRLGPPPAHLLAALVRYSPLTPAERLRAISVAAALRHVDFDDPDVDRQTFGGWLAEHGQRPQAIDRLWRLVSLAALNIEPADASLALAARVFRTGLLDDVRGGDLVVPRVPLADLHDLPARRLLARLGVLLQVGERVVTLSRTLDGGVLVRTASNELEADAVVMAVPHRQAAALVPPEAAPDRDRWVGLGSSPIVNVHVRYDRPVLRWPFAAALDSPVQWVFDRTAAARVPGQYVVVSLSAADGLRDQRADDIERVQLAGLRALLPAAEGARVLDSFVTREPHATFRQRAGTAALRPPAATAWPHLVLAGAWTATGWPDTMEGAVRSGSAAAAHLGPPAALAADHSARAGHQVAGADRGEVPA